MQKYVKPVNHIKNSGWRAKYLPYDYKTSKVKSAMRKEAMEQDQRDLSNPSDSSESDKEE